MKATSDTKPEPAAKQRGQYVYAVRPKCPTCGGVRLLVYATRKNNDDSLTRYAKCECGEKIILVVE